MPNGLALPKGFPGPTRFPSFVTPRAATPQDVISALASMEADTYSALVREPALSAGLTAPPDIPGPARLLAQAGLPAAPSLPTPGQGGQGEVTVAEKPVPAPSRIIPLTFE